MGRVAPHLARAPHRPGTPAAPSSVRAGSAIALLALLLLAVAPAHATFMMPAFPYRPKECTLIRKDGVYHLFYTRGVLYYPFDSTWRDIGHATSTDLIGWSDQPPVLANRPSNWDNFQVWAPQLLLRDGVYYMFYTGITHRPPAYDHHQRIGLATSTDLMNWTRYDQPVFECSQVPWTHCIPSQPGAGDFRDPYVMPDPDSTGHWLMFYTTRHEDAPGDLIIGVARSDGDFTQWTDVGPMWNTFVTRSYSSVVESPDLIQHGALWYLLYTTWLSHPIWFQTAASPLADSTHWSWPRSLDSEVIQIDTDPSFGPEHYTVDGHDLYLMPNSRYDAIELLEYQWKTPPDFDLVQPFTTLGRAEVAPGAEAAGFALHAGSGPPPIALWLDLPRGTTVHAWVGDVTGRRVRDLGAVAGPGGRSRLEWDGRDARGDAAPAGVYLAVVESALGRRIGRFTLLR